MGEQTPWSASRLDRRRAARLIPSPNENGRSESSLETGRKDTQAVRP
jgi:hypothetical protein